MNIDEMYSDKVLASALYFFYKKFRVTESGCWEWTAAVAARTGYAVHTVRRKYFLAHRFSYLMHNGDIPEGLEISHICHNRTCVNPDHLVAETHLVNMRRGWNAAKTHCKRGHELSGDNVFISGKGSRECKQCHKIRAENFKLKKIGK